MSDQQRYENQTFKQHSDELDQSLQQERDIQGASEEIIYKAKEDKTEFSLLEDVIFYDDDLASEYSEAIRIALSGNTAPLLTVIEKAAIIKAKERSEPREYSGIFKDVSKIVGILDDLSIRGK